MKATVLIPAAGMGRRMGTSVSKQYLALAGKPILAHTVALFEHHPQIDHIYLIVPEDDIDYCRQQIVEPYDFAKITRIVAGGKERQDSVLNGLKALQDDQIDQAERPVLIHDGARPLFDSALLTQLITIVMKKGACAVGVPVKDTIKDVENCQIMGSPDRKRLWHAQTPQGFQYGLLRKAFDQAIADGFIGTDDASLVERTGHRVHLLEGSYRNIKVTTPEDLQIAAALLGMLGKGVVMRIGHGYDVHQLVENRPLILGGVTIEHELGLLGHSDADVLLHAICDAILGALALGDLGRHFPDTDDAYAGIDSRELLRQVIDQMKARDYKLVNLDTTLLCQKPKLAPHIQQMVANIADDCQACIDQVNVKATTTEKLGFAGRCEGIAAYAVVLLEKDEKRVRARRATVIS